MEISPSRAGLHPDSRLTRVHNLKNVSLSIPHNQLTVMTGVSGSGKSSLAFDTIYAEGQRRYVESLSAYARQFLERMEKPEVEEIDGIAPAVAIRQKNTSRNPRSTVATSTESYDFLRLLYARSQDVRFYLRHTRAAQHGGRSGGASAPTARRLALVCTVRGGEHGAPARPSLRTAQEGFNRLFQSGKMFEFSTPESLLEIDFAKPVFILADRIAVGPDLHQRLVDTIEICYREAGEVIFEAADGSRQIRFNEKFQCKTCGAEFNPPEPILFSFNSFLARPRCQGFGNTIDFDMDRIIRDKTLSLEEGAVEPWTASGTVPGWAT